ncbi:hypothetical protein [Stieleria varia]|uniref:DUF1287 domain-containing protein n=1 Tax=Stieleria varia TaxID=2528005 RepID=A0A5C6B824_9BACT|nr:hypothetical protein [Stieleria varia]TWU07439.1 hypothetical protein Pla52n_00120 [Stieleria varia]
MTKLKLCVACLLFVFASAYPFNGDELFDSNAPPHTRFANRMEALLGSLTKTGYQHTTQIDEAKGQVNCDCSGLVGFVLRHTYPEAYVSLRGDEAPWRKHPLSVTYFETFMVDTEGECMGFLSGEREVISNIAIGRIAQPEKPTSHAEDVDFIGLKTEKASELAKERKLIWRIIRQDGISMPPGMAINVDRLNFVIQNNQVIRVLRG